MLGGVQDTDNLKVCLCCTEEEYVISDNDTSQAFEKLAATSPYSGVRSQYWTSPRLAGAELRVYSPAGGFTHGDGATDFHSGI